LVFDDDEIPAFLRKDHPGSKPAKIEEPVGAPLIEEPANENVAVVDETPAAQEAPAEVASEVQAPAVECHGTTDGDGSDEPTIEDLQRQQQEIDRKIQEKREAEKRSVIEQIVSVVNTYKIPVEELVEALGGMKVKRKGVKAKPKYKDPATGQIWSGRGKEPAWIKGKDRKPFEL
jgi:DNA-binding protein H-NS